MRECRYFIYGSFFGKMPDIFLKMENSKKIEEKSCRNLKQSSLKLLESLQNPVSGEGLPLPEDIF